MRQIIKKIDNKWDEFRNGHNTIKRLIENHPDKKEIELALLGMQDAFETTNSQLYDVFAERKYPVVIVEHGGLVDSIEHPTIKNAIVYQTHKDDIDEEDENYYIDDHGNKSMRYVWDLDAYRKRLEEERT